MLDLLLSLCAADLLVGLITIPVDLIHESGVLANHPFLFNFTTFIAQGKIYIDYSVVKHVISVPHIASILTLILISYEDRINKKV